jgi:hypothetical protein
MTAPLPKYEITIRRCPNPVAISTGYSSPAALHFLRKCSGFFDSPWLDSDDIPGRAVLVVHSCYDFDDVWAFLAENPMVHVLPPITMDSPSTQPERP